MKAKFQQNERKFYKEYMLKCIKILTIFEFNLV